MSPWCTLAVFALSQAIVTASQLDHRHSSMGGKIARTIGIARTRFKIGMKNLGYKHPPARSARADGARALLSALTGRIRVALQKDRAIARQASKAAAHAGAASEPAHVSAAEPAAHVAAAEPAAHMSAPPNPPPQRDRAGHDPSGGPSPFRPCGRSRPIRRVFQTARNWTSDCNVTTNWGLMSGVKEARRLSARLNEVWAAHAGLGTVVCRREPS
jgi:hypothetical protein